MKRGVNKLKIKTRRERKRENADAEPSQPPRQELEEYAVLAACTHFETFQKAVANAKERKLSMAPNDRPVDFSVLKVKRFTGGNNVEIGIPEKLSSYHPDNLIAIQEIETSNLFACDVELTYNLKVIWNKLVPVCEPAFWDRFERRTNIRIIPRKHVVAPPEACR